MSQKHLFHTIWFLCSLWHVGSELRIIYALSRNRAIFFCDNKYHYNLSPAVSKWQNHHENPSHQDKRSSWIKGCQHYPHLDKRDFGAGSRTGRVAWRIWIPISRADHFDGSVEEKKTTFIMFDHFDGSKSIYTTWTFCNSFHSLRIPLDIVGRDICHQVLGRSPPPRPFSRALQRE